MKKIISIIASFFVVLQLAVSQAGEVVGTFLVTSATGSDPSPVVTGTYNSTLGFTSSSVQVGDFLFVRQVIGNVHRRKVYEITAKTASGSQMTLTLALFDGVSGGPFPTGVQVITRMSQYGLVYDAPHPSQEMESYVINYAMSHLEGEDVDTIIERNDSLFVTFRGNDRELYAGPTSATAIDTSYQIGDSIYVVSAGDTIFTGIAYNNAGIDTTLLISGTWYIITTEGDTLPAGVAAQVVVGDSAPVNPATYLIHIDTLGTDTLWVDNDSVWVRFNVGGSSIGSAYFIALNETLTSFHPSGVPPIGAAILNPFKGSTMRKYGPGLIFDVTEPDGRTVYPALRHFEFDTLDLWDLSKRSAANLAVDAVNGYADVPLNIDGLQRGGVRILILINQASVPRTFSFSDRYREPDGTTPLAPITVTNETELTLEFTLDATDNLMVMRLSAHPYGAGTTYTFQDSANGIDLNESGGTVTVAPDITELTYAAVVGADSIMIWDNSLNAHRRTSIAEIVALASAGTVTVTDQANGLDITLTGSDITIAYDFGELANAAVASADSLVIKDVSAGGYRRVSAGSIAALATASNPVTGVNDQPNGIDVTLNGSLVEVAYDFDELPVDAFYNGLEIFPIKDLSDGLYKSASTSWLSGGYMDLLTNQTVSNGVKKWASGTGLQYGTGTMPTGIPFGSANQTVFGLKGGTTAFVSEANWQDYGGMVFENNWDAGTGFQTSRIIATGNDSGNDGSYLELWTRPNGSAQNVARNIRFASNASVPAILVGASNGAGGGHMNFTLGGVGFDGASSNYRLSGVNATAGFGLFENGGLNMEVPPGQQSWVPFSDSTMKHNIVQLSPTKEQMRSFKSYTYDWDASDSTTIGVIAQEIEALYPEIVHGLGYTGDSLGVDYFGIAAICFGAISELQEQIDAPRDTIRATEFTSTGVTAERGKINPVNSSGVVSTLTVNPPASPLAGEWFGVSDSRGSAASKNIIIDFTTASQKLHGATANYTISTNSDYARFTYLNGTVGWVKTN